MNGPIKWYAEIPSTSSSHRRTLFFPHQRKRSAAVQRESGGRVRERLKELATFESTFVRMKYSLLQIGVCTLIVLMHLQCQPSTQNNNTMPPIDINKRNELVQRYDLLHMAGKKEPVLFTLDEFFDGNNDEASIAPNFTEKPFIGEYYRTFKALAEDPRNVAAFAEIKDINIYPNGNLHDDEWFYTDVTTSSAISLPKKSLPPPPTSCPTKSITAPSLY